MKYYKVFVDNTLIGVASSNDFRRYYKRTQFIGPATEETGEVISCAGKLYRDNWMLAVIDNSINYIPATLREITEEEYTALSPAEDGTIEIDEDEIIVPDEVINPEDVATIEYARTIKLEELSRACNKEIESGFSLGGRHYSMTAQDQLNLLAAEMAVNNGEEEIMYHADGEDYRYFNVEEILLLVQTAKNHRLNNTIKLKSLKKQVNSLNNANDILAIKW